MMSTIRPMFSSATLRTSRPRTDCTVRGSRTAADGGSGAGAGPSFGGLSFGISEVGAALCAYRLADDAHNGTPYSASNVAATATEIRDRSRICPSGNGHVGNTL